MRVISKSRYRTLANQGSRIYRKFDADDFQSSIFSSRLFSFQIPTHPYRLTVTFHLYLITIKFSQLTVATLDQQRTGYPAQKVT